MSAPSLMKEKCLTETLENPCATICSPFSPPDTMALLVLFFFLFHLRENVILREI